MPGVVGALDGTYIPISGVTTEYMTSYINRKGYSSMHLHVVCDSSLRLTDIHTGWPGSVHDAYMFRNSPDAQIINTLPEDFHLLRDSSYLLSKHVIPYRDNGLLNIEEKKFKFHSSTRVDVERAIGLVKCKFRRLKFLDMKMEEIPVVISSSCVTHNFIWQEENYFDDIDIGKDEENLGDCPTAGEVVRDGMQKQRGCK